MSRLGSLVDRPKTPVFRRTGHVPEPFAWPAVGLLLLGLLIPIGMIFLDSFRLRGVIGGFAPINDLWVHITSGTFLKNYADATKTIYLAIFWRSLWMAAGTTILCLLAAYPMAYWLGIHVSASRRPIGLLLVVIPFWTSFVVRTFAWLWILRSEGLINHLLVWLGWAPVNFLFDWLDPVVLVGLVYGELPFMILPIYAAVERLDRSLLEASADLGANPVMTFLKVTLPLTFPGIAAGIVLVFVPSVGQYLISDMLGQGKYMLVGNLIQNQFAGAKNQPFGFALAFLLTALVLGLLWVYTQVVKSRGGKLEDLL